MRFVGGFVEAFTLLIIVISLFHLNLIGFFDRKREIGTVLAMGAKPRWVVRLLLVEMLLLGASSFGVAVAVYSAMMEILSRGIDFGGLSIIFAGNPLRLDLEPLAVLQSAAVVLVAIASSAAYPAYLAARIDPVEVFREGNL